MRRSMLGVAVLAAVIAVMPLTAMAKGGKGGGGHHGGGHHGGGHHHRGGVVIVAPALVGPVVRGCGPYKHWSRHRHRCVWN